MLIRRTKVRPMDTRVFRQTCGVVRHFRHVTRLPPIGELNYAPLHARVSVARESLPPTANIRMRVFPHYRQALMSHNTGETRLVIFGTACRHTCVTTHLTLQINTAHFYIPNPNIC